MTVVDVKTDVWLWRQVVLSADVLPAISLILSYRTVLDFVKFGLCGKFLGLPRGWTILDAAYRLGFLPVVSWR